MTFRGLSLSQIGRYFENVTYLPRYLYGRYMPFAKSWSSLDKEESLACKITSPFNNNRFFLKNKIALQKQPIFLLNGEVIWQATDSS